MTPALVGTGVRSRHRGCGLGTVPHLNSGSLGSPPGFTQAFFRFFYVSNDAWSAEAVCCFIFRFVVFYVWPVWSARGAVACDREERFVCV